MREASAEEAAPLLAPAAQYDTTKGAESAESVARAGRNFIVERDGAPIFTYSLAVYGTECYVLAAAGAADIDLTGFGLMLIEAQAAGLESVAFQTRRPGLIRKAARRGYRLAGRVANGVIMRKVLR